MATWRTDRDSAHLRSERRRVRRWPKPVVVVVLVAGVLSAAQLPAGACSCAVSPAEVQLDWSDGAFIGSLVESSPTAGAPNNLSLGASAVFTFEVTEWIKGDRAPGLFDVYSSEDGVSCGFEVRPGQEVAVYLEVRNELFATSGLCSTGDAANLRATVNGPTTSAGPATYVATGWYEPTHLLAADGGLIAAQSRDDQTQLGGFHAPCGGSIVAEYRGTSIVLVDVSTFTDVEQFPIDEQVWQLLCEGDRLLAMVGGEYTRAVLDVRSGSRLDATVTDGMPALLSNQTLTYLSAANDQDGRGWRTLDLTTGENEFIIEMPTGEQRMEWVDFSPGGQHIALTLAEGNQSIIDIVVVDTAAKSATARTIDAHTAALHWLDEQQLLVRVGHGGYSDTQPAFVAEASDLTTLIEYDSQLFTFWPGYLNDDRVIGMEGGRVVSMPLAGGPIDILNELPINGPLTRLPDPIEIPAEYRTPETSRETPISSPIVEALEARSALVEQPPSESTIPSATSEVPQTSAPTDSNTDEQAADVTPSATPDSSGTIAIIAGAIGLALLGTALHHRRRPSDGS